MSVTPVYSAQLSLWPPVAVHNASCGARFALLLKGFLLVIAEITPALLLATLIASEELRQRFDLLLLGNYRTCCARFALLLKGSLMRLAEKNLRCCLPN